MFEDYENESNDNYNNGIDSVKSTCNNYDTSYFPHGVIPENPANGRCAKEIAHTATVCLNWWRSGIKSVKMIGDLTGLDSGYVLIVLQYNCGVSEEELRKQYSINK